MAEVQNSKVMSLKITKQNLKTLSPWLQHRPYDSELGDVSSESSSKFVWEYPFQTQKAWDQ